MDLVTVRGTDASGGVAIARHLLGEFPLYSNAFLDRVDNKHEKHFVATATLAETPKISTKYLNMSEAQARQQITQGALKFVLALPLVVSC